MAAKREGWEDLKLSDCATFQEGYVNPPQTVAAYFGTEIKWLRAIDLNDSFVFETSRRLSRAGYESAGRSAYLFEPNTIGISKSGTIGRLGILKDYMCGNRAVINIRVDLKKYDSRFIFYSLLQRRREIEELAAGSVQRNLYCNVLGELEIGVPSLTEQRAIARVLGSLDDKMELNRQMNETLATMARTLFKSWFVDFDPVRAKAEGRDPKLSLPLVSLFPNELKDSELGEIPKGWDFGSILTKAKLLSGGTPKTERRDYWDGGIAWASAKDVSQCADRFLIATERTITDNGLEESATQLIPAFSTVVVARGATTGRMVLFGREMAMNQTCYALVSRTKTPFALYCQLFEGMGGLVHAAHGSVFDTITTSTFNTSRFILAPDHALEAFEKLVSPMFERMLKNCEESRALCTIRDTLLPKLIFGELRVKGAEKRAEALV